MDQGVEVIRRLAKGSNDDDVDSAKRAQLKLRWSDGALGSATVSLVSVLCLGQVFSIELTRPLVDCLRCLLSFPVDCIFSFWVRDRCK